MPKTKISEYDTTPSSNSDMAGIDISEGCSPAGINDAIRAGMSHLKKMDNGTDAMTSPVFTTATMSGGTINSAIIGGSTKAAGSFTDLVSDTFTLNSVAIGSADITKLAAVTVTAAEINSLSGANSSETMQAQMDTKAPLASPTFTGNVTAPNVNFVGGTQTWTAAASGTSLTFSYNGVDKAVIDASNATIGLLGEQASSTWATGTGTTESLISPAKLKAAIDQHSPISAPGSAPVYGVRAWVNFAGNGANGANATLNGSGNVASVYKTGHGNYTVTFSTALPDAHYAITDTGAVRTVHYADDATAIDVYSQSASGFSFAATDPSNNNLSSPRLCMLTVVR